MKKRLLILSLCLILAGFTLVGCGSNQLNSSKVQDEIDQLQNELKGYNDKIDNLTGQLSEANNKINDLTGQLSGANNKIDNLTGQLSGANNKINDLTGQLSGNKTYKLGDTMNVYNNGLLLFSIKFERLEPVKTLFMSLTNHCVPYQYSYNHAQGICFTIYSLDADSKVSSRYGEEFSTAIGGSTSWSRSFAENTAKLVFGYRADDPSDSYSDEFVIPFGVFKF